MSMDTNWQNSWQRQSLMEILKAHADNPIKVMEKLDLHLVKNEGNAEAIVFIKVAKKLCEQLAEKRLRNRIKDIVEIGGTIEDAKIIELAHAMHAAGEITEDECVKMLVDTTTREQIEAYAAKLDTPYKFEDTTLKKICELLKKDKYINNTDNFFSGLKGVLQTRKVWLKSKPVLIYLIEKLREDDKCPYAEYSRLLKIDIASKHKESGYREIDELIKKATKS